VRRNSGLPCVDPPITQEQFEQKPSIRPAGNRERRSRLHRRAEHTTGIQSGFAFLDVLELSEDDSGQFTAEMVESRYLGTWEASALPLSYTRISSIPPHRPKGFQSVPQVVLVRWATHIIGRNRQLDGGLHPSRSRPA